MLVRLVVLQFVTQEFKCQYMDGSHVINRHIEQHLDVIDTGDFVVVGSLDDFLHVLVHRHPLLQIILFLDYL